MKKPLFVLFLLSVLPVFAHAEAPVNALGLTLEGLITDTESPAGGRSEKHLPRLGAEYSRTIWPRLEVFLGAGLHRIKMKNGASETKLKFGDVRIGARQYLLPRTIAAWSPFIDAAVVEGRLRDPASTVGNNRPYTGWNASLGVAKLLSDSIDLRLALGYQQVKTDDQRNDHTDVLSSIDLRLAVLARF